jgi:hypothetical protein
VSIFTSKNLLAILAYFQIGTFTLALLEAQGPLGLPSSCTGSHF